MKRRALSFTAVLLLVGLVGAEAAAKAPVPRVGWYEGKTSQHDELLAAGVRVIGRGGNLTVGLNMGIEVKCPRRTAMTLSTTRTVVGKSDGALGAPVRLGRNATFALNRTVPRGVGGSMRVRIVGRFRSATKVTGTILLSEVEDEAAPEASCDGVQKIAFVAHYAPRKGVAPSYGFYFGQTVGPPEDGNVEVHETEAKVVRVGKRQGAQVRVSGFLPDHCDGTQMPGGFAVLEKTPIPIERGRFGLDRTTHPTLASGLGRGTMRTVVLGKFRSPVKLAIEVFVELSFSVKFPGQPEIAGTCTGRQTGVALHR